MSKKKLSDKYILIKKIRFTLLLSILWFIYGCIAVFSFTLATVLATVSTLIYLFIILFYLKASYKAYNYIINTEHITIEKGVFFSRKSDIFKNRVQYTQLIQTPLQKLFHTCTIAYQTAGAVVYLCEIDLNQAEEVMFNEKKA